MLIGNDLLVGNHDAKVAQPLLIIQFVETLPLASTLTETMVGPRMACAFQAPPDWRLRARTLVYPSAWIAALAAASFPIRAIVVAPSTSGELRASSSGSSRLGGPARTIGTGGRDVLTLIVVARAGGRAAAGAAVFASVAGMGKDDRFSPVNILELSGIGNNLCALPMPIAVARAKAGNQRFIAQPSR